MLIPSFPCGVDNTAVDRLKSFSSAINETGKEKQDDIPHCRDGNILSDDPSRPEFRARILSPEPMFCDGLCRENKHFGKQSKFSAKVVSTRIEFDAL